MKPQPKCYRIFVAQLLLKKLFAISSFSAMLASGTAFEVVFTNASSNFSISRGFSGASIGAKKLQWNIFSTFNLFETSFPQATVFKKM